MRAQDAARESAQPTPSTWSAPAAMRPASFNISTCAAFIVAGARRAGRQTRQPRAVVALRRRRCAGRARRQDRSDAGAGRPPAFREAGIGFMFAPAHHPAMKNVGPTRVELGTRTIFNLLGPLLQSGLASSARWSACSRGSGSSRWRRCCKNLGSTAIWVVHGSRRARRDHTTRHDRAWRRSRTARSAAFDSDAGRYGPAARRSRDAAQGRRRRTTMPWRCSTCSKASRRLPRRGAASTRPRR